MKKEPRLKITNTTEKKMHTCSSRLTISVTLATLLDFQHLLNVLNPDSCTNIKTLESNLQIYKLHKLTE
jgi:hypothetical protein